VRFEPDTRARMRRGLMRKGRELAGLLADVLAGLDRSRALRGLALDDKPGERPEEKLRRYLGLVEARRSLLDAGSDDYGRCEMCGAELPAMALVEMPWADRCPAHHG
jgi:RNA polymerase-binding transcription factor DksA